MNFEDYEDKERKAADADLMYAIQTIMINSGPPEIRAQGAFAAIERYVTFRIDRSCDAVYTNILATVGIEP